MTKSSDGRKERRAVKKAHGERVTLFREAMSTARTHGPRTIYAHEQVLDTARGMAREVYDDIMTNDNELYAEWKRMCPELTPEECEEWFVALLTPRLLEPARATLARMLASPAHEHLHAAIYDALCKDNILRVGRNAPEGRMRVHVGPDGETKVTRH